MREALRQIADVPGHLGLAYDAWAPVGQGGKVPEDKRADWLSKLANLTVSPDYARAFERWKSSFGSGDRLVELTLASRLLVGHGNASATDVGVTTHHTWGVPVIPGSALKGLLAHYVDAVYGPADPSLLPWEQPDGERDRARYQGMLWNERRRRVQRGPGEVYRVLFGAPDADEDGRMREHDIEAGGGAGHVVFHDALYVPGSAETDRPYATDVLTVHQKSYYHSSGGTWPNDYDSPNPVAFLTVRPGTRMFVALSGPPDWTEMAGRLLRDALEQWGVGGKTSAGYGRLVPPERSAGSGGCKGSPGVAPAQATPKPGERVDAVLQEQRTKRGGWRARHEPSGLAGPVQNSAIVPPEKKPGDRMVLIVKIAKGQESAFEYPTETDAARSEQKGRK
jgi:CRISPR-associated protein Cmr6